MLVEASTLMLAPSALALEPLSQLSALPFPESYFSSLSPIYSFSATLSRDPHLRSEADTAKGTLKHAALSPGAELALDGAYPVMPVSVQPATMASLASPPIDLGAGSPPMSQQRGEDFSCLWCCWPEHPRQNRRESLKM